MKRRAFFGFLGGAAVSGPALAKAATDNAILKHAGFPMGGESIVAAPSMPVAASTGAVSKIVRWIRRSGIPEWKMTELRRRADYNRKFGLDPDLACLVSVSAGFKARAQRQRNIEREIESSLSSIGRHSALNAFNQKVRDRFGEGLDWYD